MSRYLWSLSRCSIEALMWLITPPKSHSPLRLHKVQGRTLSSDFWEVAQLHAHAQPPLTMKSLLRVMAFSMVLAKMERLKSWSFGSSTHCSSPAFGMKLGGLIPSRLSLPSMMRVFIPSARWLLPYIMLLSGSWRPPMCFRIWLWRMPGLLSRRL